MSVECRIFLLLSVSRVLEISYCSVGCGSDEGDLFLAVWFILTVLNFFFVIFRRLTIKCFVCFLSHYSVKYL